MCEAAAAAVAILMCEAAAVAKKCGGRLFKLPAPASVLVEDQVKGGPRDSKHGMGLLQYCIRTVRTHCTLYGASLFVKIPQSEANKSANRWGNLRAKGGIVVPPSVYT